MNGTDAGGKRLLRRGEVYLLSGDSDFSLFRAVDTGDDFDQGASARLVLAEESVNFAGLKVE